MDRGADGPGIFRCFLAEAAGFGLAVHGLEQIHDRIDDGLLFVVAEVQVVFYGFKEFGAVVDRAHAVDHAVWLQDIFFHGARRVEPQNVAVDGYEAEF